MRRRGLMIGVVLAASGASGLLFAPIADHLISLYTWRNAFLLLGGVYGSLLAIAALGALNAPERLGARPYGQEEKTASASQGYARGLSIGEALRTRSFWGLIALSVLILSPNLFMIAHLVPYATDRGISPSLAAAALGMVAAASAVGQVILGGMADRVGWLRGAALACLVSAATTLWLIPTRNAAMLYAFVIIYGIFNGGVVTLLMGIAARFFGTRALAEILGYAIGAEVLVGGVFAFLGGAIFDWTGSYLLALAVAAACFFAAGIHCFLIRPPRARVVGDSI